MVAIAKKHKRERTPAERVYSFLIHKAVNRQTTTYEEVAQCTGLPDSGSHMGTVLGPILDAIGRLENHMSAPIVSIVVRKSGQDVGLPGRGFWKLMGWADDTSRAVKRDVIVMYHNKVYERYAVLADSK